MPPRRKAAAAKSVEPLDGCVLAISGTFSVSRAEFTKLVNTNGGSIANSVTKAVTHLVTTDAEFQGKTAKVVAAEAKGLPIVSEDWVHESIKAGAKEDEASYTIGAAAAAPAATGKRKAGAAAPASKPAATKKGKAVAADPAPAAAAAAAPAAASQTIKVIKKGSAPVDPYSGAASSKHVLEEGDEVYNCMLNQTNIGAGQNNNKFYVIQALEADGGGGYAVFTRWGRVGEKGQQAMQACGNKDACIKAYKSKFREKTKNDWDNRANFTPVSGKYTLLEMDYGDEPEEEKPLVKAAKPAVQRKESTLDPKVQNLVRLIFDMKMMEQTMISMEYDVKKMPLGKLKKSTVLKGYEVLKQIEDEMKGSNNASKLAQYSGQFYTVIPHAYGRSTKPPVINTHEMLKSKMQMLEALSDIEIATHLMEAAEDEGGDKSLLDMNYKALKTEIEPVDAKELADIQKYVTNSWENGKGPKIINAYRLDREGEVARFNTKKGLGNRKLLWHGSRLSNYVGIISQGLRIAPPEAPCSGYRFGKGVYFADMMSLSARYCRSGSSDYCMLLADVALGKTAELPRDQFMTKPLPGTDSTHALGRIHPDPKEDKVVDGVTYPLGKPVPTGNTAVSCHENQFVVYDVAQVNLKYMLHLAGNH
eukprot:CAMPEP_0114554936 /NCGR_PEP_ID=MMETSP0114-20121206/8477_1 /TAXON_ID=31324 /ORGANISM="Goniomonas sp, Strain m" /LENGTH=645 /DNA_ID=CAMNT_0001740019 /DNA_START=6 /DNA_END=1943 /DNA_ORIENTATION=-